MTFEAWLAKCNTTATIEPPSQVHEHIIPLPVKFVTEHLQPASKILDVGCGMALTAANLFKDAGHSVTCISIFPEEVASARNQGFESYCHDMHDLSAYREYALVWLRHIAEHSGAPTKLLFEAHEATSELGMLYLEVPDPWTACMHDVNPNHRSVKTAAGWLNDLHFTGWKELRPAAKWMPITGFGPDAYTYFLCVKA